MTTTSTYKSKPEYRTFNGEKYKLYAVTESVSGAKHFIKDHKLKFKGVKMTKSPNVADEWIIWAKL